MPASARGSSGGRRLRGAAVALHTRYSSNSAKAAVVHARSAALECGPYGGGSNRLRD